MACGGRFYWRNLQRLACRRGSCRSLIPARTRFTKRAWARKSGVARAAREGITHIIFGDLFLADIRAYREQKLAGTGIAPVFPLWERPTLALAHAMIESGLEAYLATVDLKKLPVEFAGRKFDLQLLADLPGGVDPCGENGEFHTCVVAGPMFSRALPVTPGERVERDGYGYCDLVMAEK
jgi:diphthamide synthase (EF-2-diphthine--ammonia ligase)